MLNQQHFSTFSIANTLAKYDIVIDDITSKNIVNDSRFVETGDIFTAVAGTSLVGSDFINDAIAKGAVVVLVQCTDATHHGDNKRITVQGNTATVISFYQLDSKLAGVSAHYYNNPSKDITLIGVTGTNGKTSCCQLIAQLLTSNNQQAAIIGTLGAGKINALVDINNTTPGPTKLQQLLAEFKADGVSNVAMEVSSHALSQKRVDSRIVDIAVFTNLSRDHLDYHGDMASYSKAKQALFNGTDEQVWVLNSDDAQTSIWLGDLARRKNRTVLYSCELSLSAIKSKASSNEYLLAQNIKCHNQGVSFDLHSSWGDISVNSSLLGEFNVSNLLAAMATLLVQGISLSDICKYTDSLTAVAGRMEAFTATNKPTAIVDYAHTPDGLEKALIAAKKHCQAKLWLVFGCGGDRDKGKRAMMGAIAEQYAEQIIVTNDNPRTEEPMAIAKDILSGFKVASNADVIIDRKQAVLSALSRAQTDDMVLCAGKGHEDYLIIGTQKVAYDERDIVRQFYQGSDA